MRCVYAYWLCALTGLVFRTEVGSEPSEQVDAHGKNLDDVLTTEALADRAELLMPGASREDVIVCFSKGRINGSALLHALNMSRRTRTSSGRRSKERAHTQYALRNRCVGSLPSLE